MPAGTVEVFLIGAVGIKDTEIFGKADPYAILICGRQKLQSNTASNQGSKPIWNQKFSFYIDDKATDLQIRIYNHNILHEDDELGSTIIPLSKVFVDGKLPTTSYNVVRPSNRVQGEVKLSISFTPKQRSGQQTRQDIPGPYNTQIHGSPYSAIPPQPAVKHDPLTGPYGYFKQDSSTKPSSHGSNKPNSFFHNSYFGSNGPYPPPDVNAHPSTIYPPVSSMNRPYPDTGSDASFQQTTSFSPLSGESSHGRLYPVPPCTSTDYTGNIYGQSPYGHGTSHPSQSPHDTASSHHGATSVSSPTAYPPPGHQNSFYPPYTKTKPPKFGFEDLAGNFGSLKISGSNNPSLFSECQNTQNSDNKPLPEYPLQSVSGHSTYDHPLSGRPISGSPPFCYPTPGYTSGHDSNHEEYPQPGSYSLYGYQSPPRKFYPQQPHGTTEVESPPSPSQNAYRPAPYRNAPWACYIPAGYPK